MSQNPSRRWQLPDKSCRFGSWCKIEESKPGWKGKEQNEMEDCTTLIQRNNAIYCEGLRLKRLLSYTSQTSNISYSGSTWTIFHHTEWLRKGHIAATTQRGLHPKRVFAINNICVLNRAPKRHCSRVPWAKLPSTCFQEISREGFFFFPGASSAPQQGNYSHISQ